MQSINVSVFSVSMRRSGIHNQKNEMQDLQCHAGQCVERSADADAAWVEAGRQDGTFITSRNKAVEKDCAPSKRESSRIPFYVVT